MIHQNWMCRCLGDVGHDGDHIGALIGDLGNGRRVDVEARW